MSALAVRAGVPLGPRTTLGLGGPARAFVEARDEATVAAAFAWASEQGFEVAVLGGGSNLVVADAGFDGLVIAIATTGIAERRVGDAVHVEAAAGESWDGLVARTVDAGLAGLECLSGIPGSVGATPVQNVGAYGQEVSDTLVSVRVFDPVSREIRQLEASTCEFAYRDSMFKHHGRHLVVLAATFALRPGGEAQIRYAELERALEGAPRDLAEVRRAVLALRRNKGMLLEADDPERRTAGSFFTNPIVGVAEAEAVAERARSLGITAELPRWAQPDGRIKLAAGWLIEKSGVTRGMSRGAVGVSRRHALALVHHGGGTTASLLALADEIVETVHARFGVTLRREPVLWGV